MTYPPGSGYSGDYAPSGQSPQQPPYPPYGAQQPFGYPSAPQSPGPSNDKTSGLAIASLITSLLGCTALIGLILGIVALFQIKQRGQRGRGMAIAGIVVSSLWFVVSVVGLVLSSGSGSATSSSVSSSGGQSVTPEPTVTSPKDVDADEMRIGDCINDESGAVTTSDDEGVEVESVKVVPCDQPHDGEVLAAFHLQGAVQPSEQETSRLASSGCRARVVKKLNRDPAARNLTYSYYYPTPRSWLAGDRTVTCVAVHATDGQKLTRRIRTS